LKHDLHHRLRKHRDLKTKSTMSITHDDALNYLNLIDAALEIWADAEQYGPTLQHVPDVAGRDDDAYTIKEYGTESPIVVLGEVLKDMGVRDK